MKKVEWFGVPVITVFGTLLHYTYAASGEIQFVGFVSAMNESVWEHLKLAFWPGVAWTLFLAYVFGWTSHLNFWFARVSAITVAPILIVILFYGYTAVLGGNFLYLDLIIFVVSIVIGQKTALKLYSVRPLPAVFEKLALIILLLEGVCFVAFSIFPPNHGIFQP